MKKRTLVRYIGILLVLIVSLLGTKSTSVPMPGNASTPPPTHTPSPSTEASVTSAVVARVVDGDTIVLDSGEKVRYIGIDTPESVDPRRPVECFGKEASNQNRQLVEGKTVRLERDVSKRDSFGRLLLYVWVNDQMVNELLVKNGYARVSTYPPDVKYVNRLKAAEQEARDQKRGLWSGCSI